MKDEFLYNVAQDLISIPPLIFRGTRRKVLKPAFADTDVHISHIHFEIIRLLKDEGTMHAAAIGKHLHIAKAQMTKLIDRLVAFNLVTRETDRHDRRITNISLSDYGNKLLEEKRQCILKDICESIANLSDEDVICLSDSLRKLNEILSKLK